MHFRILKMITTSSLLTALECTKVVSGRRSAPDPTGGAYSAPLGELTAISILPSWFKGPILLRRGEGKERGKGGEGYARGGEGRGKREGKESRNTPSINSCTCPCCHRSSCLYRCPCTPITALLQHFCLPLPF